ncbi:transglycosylase domain-containing protein [Actinomadura alba]|uniref:Transglycosylase domain-containing protein n=1 Tax=Actinomadura alba TaxID=406431 RepID=A0ABR7M276_9ACTN|nr:transglycosylase domain-containing protein [Actinomadura alba]MBC6470683.1 transglycosylase domain-containing protein [Actinomadura alba]
MSSDDEDAVGGRPTVADDDGTDRTKAMARVESDVADDADSRAGSPASGPGDTPGEPEHNDTEAEPPSAETQPDDTPADDSSVDEGSAAGTPADVDDTPADTRHGTPHDTADDTPVDGIPVGDVRTDGSSGGQASTDTAPIAMAGGLPPGRRPPAKRPRGRFARYARRTGLTMLGLVGLGVLGFAIAYLLTPIPSAQSGAKAEGSVFYYADGKTVIAKQGTNRVVVPLSSVPAPVRAAVISAENRSFYNDPGVSLTSTTRALWSTVSGEQVQGGSTITQQMVRNYYSGLSQERTVFRKLKEIMVALKVGREKDKDWILQQYLNTIYFGRNAYGIQAAAKAYYNTDVKKLTPEQGAYLAAAIQLPSYFADPYGDKRAPAEARWRYVIEGMVRLGAVTPSDAAAMKFPVPPEQKHTDVLKGQVGYMMDTAKAELEARGYAEDEVNRGGLKVVTTFDKKLMDAAARAVNSNVPDDTSKNVLTGLVSINSANGEVEAFYGGRDYLQRQLNSSFGSYAQAGSGFKPYVLAAALDDGLGLDTTVNGSSPQTFNNVSLENNNNTSYGMVDLVTATQQSINTAYINLGQEVGLDKVTAMAEKLGIPERQLTANSANTSPTFPLGTVSVSPLQQASAYATFAAEGVHHQPHVIKSITRPGGKPEKITDKGTQAFSKGVARDATYAMSKVVEAGTGTAAQLYDREVAGKTGTTTKGRAIWFNGFIPQMATSVGIFRTDNKPLEIPGYAIYGGVLPAQIWRSYMAEATQDMPVKNFAGPTVSNRMPRDTAPATPRSTESTKPTPTAPPEFEPSEEPVEPVPPPEEEPYEPPIEPPPGTTEPRPRLVQPPRAEPRGGHAP